MSIPGDRVAQMRRVRRLSHEDLALSFESLVRKPITAWRIQSIEAGVEEASTTELAAFASILNCSAAWLGNCQPHLPIQPVLPAPDSLI